MSRPTRRDVGGDQQLGGLAPQPVHDAVALLLAHPTVQGLGPVPATVHRLGELVDLGAGAAEDDRRGRVLDVEHASECGGLVAARDDVGGLAHARALPAGGGLLARQRDADGVVQPATRQPVDVRRHGRGEQHGLVVRWGGVEDRVEVLGEAHVQHLVGLVQHDDLDRVERQRAATEVVQGPTRAWRPPRPRPARAPSPGARSAGRRRRAPPGRPGRGRSGGWPARPASPARGSAPAPAHVDRSTWRSPSSARWCSSGRAKAAVFPVPVAACPSRSRPASSGGIASRWIGVGSS